MNEDKNRVCPVELAGSLDNRIRRWIQNPQKKLKPFIAEGMTVLDIGCGPGFFTTEIAKMVGDPGKVIAADLQEDMLQKIKVKVAGNSLDKRILYHKCEQNQIGLTAEVDFILAYYMVHEVPDKAHFFKELRSLLKESGRMLLVEPRLFHVSEKDFYKTLEFAFQEGFKSIKQSKSFAEWSALLE